MAKSTDLGQTWTKVVTDTVKDVNPVELPDKSILTVGADHLVRSTDGGVTWTPVGETLPYTFDGGSGGFTYAVHSKTAFVWNMTCDANGMMRAGYDWE
jgi:hypothetical protein